MNSEWTAVPFGEAISDITGGNIKTPQADFATTGRFPIVDQGRGLIAGYTNDESRLCKADLPVIVFGDHTKSIKFIDFPFCLGADGTKILKPKIAVDEKYLFHYMRTLTLPDAGYSRYFKYLKRTEIRFPSPENQRRIVTILDQIEALRTLRQNSLARLNDLAQAIFDEMFCDSTANRRQWPEGILSDIVRIDDRINYGVLQPGEHVANGIPLIRAGDLLTEGISIKNVKRIDPAIEQNYSRSRLRGDEILVGCVGSIGAVMLATKEMKGANIARAVSRIPADPAKVDRLFLASQLMSNKAQRYFFSETRTVAQPTLNIKQLCETPVIIPDLSLQKAFSRRLQMVLECKERCNEHSRRIDELQASLQWSAFRGKI